jgi:hypothetical protein
LFVFNVNVPSSVNGRRDMHLAQAHSASECASKNKCRNLNVPNKLVKVLRASSIQIRSTYYARKMQCQRVVWGPGDKTRGALKSVPLFKGPGIEGGIFCMGTLPPFLGPLTKEHPCALGVLYT